jgi:hypothetical protein
MDNIVHESEHLERVVTPPPSSWRRLGDEEVGWYWAKAMPQHGTAFLFRSLGFTGPGAYCKALN